MKKDPREMTDLDLADLLRPGEYAETILFVDASLLRELVRRFEAAHSPQEKETPHE